MAAHPEDVSNICFLSSSSQTELFAHLTKVKKYRNDHKSLLFQDIWMFYMLYELRMNTCIFGSMSSVWGQLLETPCKTY